LGSTLQYLEENGGNVHIIKSDLAEPNSNIIKQGINDLTQTKTDLVAIFHLAECVRFCAVWEVGKIWRPQKQSTSFDLVPEEDSEKLSGFSRFAREIRIIITHYSVWIILAWMVIGYEKYGCLFGLDLIKPTEWELFGWWKGM